MIYKITRPDGAIEYREDSSTVLPEGATELTYEQMKADESRNKSFTVPINIQGVSNGCIRKNTCTTQG